ncbi:MAG: tyrosine-type recombinase/integrase [Agromyces sp.]
MMKSRFRGARRTLTRNTRERQAHRQPGEELEIRAPKYGSERTVYLPDGLLEVLSRHIRDVGVYGLEEWLFPGSNGEPMWPRKHQYTWDRVCLHTGVMGVTIHDLRHFYASGLIASGCDVVTVQRALGRKTATVTLNTYSHLWPSADDRTRAAAQSLIDQAFTNDPTTSGAGGALDTRSTVSP